MTIGQQIAEAIWKVYGRHLGNESHANQDSETFIRNVTGIANMLIGKDATDADIMTKLRNLHKQATTENTHYYTASVLTEAMQEIAALRIEIQRLEREPKHLGKVKFRNG